MIEGSYPAHIKSNGINPKARRELTFEEFTRAIDKLAAHGVDYATLLGGEPFLRPDFNDILRHFAARGIKLSIVTNGTLVDRYYEDVPYEGLDRVSVSIDGASKETHEFIRGPNVFEKAKNAVRLFTKMRDERNPKLHVGIQMIVSRLSVKEMSNYMDLADELDVAKVCFLMIGQLGNAKINWDKISPKSAREIRENLYQAIDNLIRINRRRELQGRHPIAFEADELTGVYKSMLWNKFFYYPHLIMTRDAYHCTAGSEFIQLLPDGEVWPCNQMIACRDSFEKVAPGFRPFNLLEDDFQRMLAVFAPINKDVNALVHKANETCSACGAPWCSACPLLMMTMEPDMCYEKPTMVQQPSQRLEVLLPVIH